MGNLWTRRKSLWEIAEELANRIPDAGTVAAHDGQPGQPKGLSYASLPQAAPSFTPSFATNPYFAAAPTGPVGLLTPRPGSTDDDGEYCNAATGDACRPPPANENRTGQETCDYAHSQCIANARMNTNTSTDYLAWRKKCEAGLKVCSEEAAKGYRVQRGEALFFRTGVVIFPPGRPAIFVPYDVMGGQ